MIKGLDGVTIGSKNATELANFYKDKVGIKIKEEFQMGENLNAFEMDAGEGSSVMIIDMPDYADKASEDSRVWLTFEVENIEKSTEEIDGKGVKKVRDTFHIEGYGYVTTYSDPDGNSFQIAQVRGGEEDHNEHDHDHEEGHDH
ncbi:MAG TPA: VOC family protein [Candidatus Saccharimonadales bacterium]|nr:VOC family protein [Candidatus Saccharimonadales bacterium]